MVALTVSLIIPIWNGSEYLHACLDSLMAHDYPIFEIIAVDNASVDGSAELIARHYPQVRLIRNAVNLGFAGGCNAGLKAAQGDILVLLNQDVIVQPGWLRALVKALQKPKIGIVGCKMLYPDGRTIQHAGGWIEWPLGLAHHYGRGEQDEGQWDESKTVDYVTGAAMAFRRDVLEQIGLLDEEFWPGYFEDTDFCFRAREFGYEIWYIPDSVALHFETKSIKNRLEIAYFYEKGRLRFVLKHLVPHRFLTEFVVMEKERVLRFTKEESNPLYQAYLEAIPMAAQILTQRWSADERTIETVILALQSLCRFAKLKNEQRGDYMKEKANISDDFIEIYDPEIDLSRIIEEIQERIRRRRKELGYPRPIFPVFGAASYPGEPKDDDYDIELYFHLRRANEIYHQIDVEPLIIPSIRSSIPILGPLWERIRREAHNLVLFYVNKLAQRQTRVNRHMVSTLNRLIIQIQEQQRRIRVLEEELRKLRESS